MIQILTDEAIINLGPGQPDAVWSYEDQLHFARKIEAAVLAKLADKLLDAEMLGWVLQHAYIAEGFGDKGAVLEIAGTDRQVPRPHDWGQELYPVRTAIDAAMLAEKAVKP